MKILSLIILMMMSVYSIAHPGHGNANVAVHDFEHMLWVVSASVLLISIVGVWALKRR